MEKYHLAVIGAGPGGYVAAIRAAQKGIKVVCIEKEKTYGGTCLNVGCIPSKALLHSTEYYYKILSEGKEHGISYADLTANLSQMMERKNSIVSGLTGGISYLFKKYHVDHIQADARLMTPTTIQAGNATIEAENILLATGSEPISLPFFPFDEKNILSSTGALMLEHIPQKMLIVGAGIIGLELGSVYRRLGTEIEVIELLDRVAPGMDHEISKNMLNILKKQGFIFKLRTKVTGGKLEEGKVKLVLGNEEAIGDCALIAIGRRPYTKGLGLDELGIRKDPFGRVEVDQSFRTSVPHIYAIGDIVDGPMLAHKASEEALAVIDLIIGKAAQVNYLAIPNVMYTWPEAASVGLTEDEAKGANVELLIGRVPFKAVPRARCSGDEEGFVKILGEKKTGRVIGLHIVGANASEMIHEGVLALEYQLTLAQIARACHAHPTNSEAIKEAALSALGEAYHV